jgi:hypothetical protein
MRWVDSYFPFTHPSLELEIFFNGDVSPRTQSHHIVNRVGYLYEWEHPFQITNALLQSRKHSNHQPRIHTSVTFRQ